MRHIKLYANEAAFQEAYAEGNLPLPHVSLAKEENIVHYLRAIIATLTVSELIEQGYATNTNGKIQILDTCPYSASQITDFLEVLGNTKKLTDGVDNSFIWGQALPASWTAQDIIDAYNQTTISGMNSYYDGLFKGVDLSSADELILSCGGTGRWFALGNAIFSNKNVASNHMPKTVTVNLAGNPSSLNSAFNAWSNVEQLNLNFVSDCLHDISGTFEWCAGLKQISSQWVWNTIRNISYTFEGCSALEEVSLSYSSNDRFSSANEIYPRRDTWRGVCSLAQTFNGCSRLSSIKPVINFNALASSADTYYAFNGCNLLTDVRFKNLNNTSWDFTDSTAGTSIPNLSVDSIEYMLNSMASQVSVRWILLDKTNRTLYEDVACTTVVNASGIDAGTKVYYADENKDKFTTAVTAYPVTIQELGGFSVTFPSLHMSEISAEAVASAEAKGWTVQFA